MKTKKVTDAEFKFKPKKMRGIDYVGFLILFAVFISLLLYLLEKETINEILLDFIIIIPITVALFAMKVMHDNEERNKNYTTYLKSMPFDALVEYSNDISLDETSKKLISETITSIKEKDFKRSNEP